MKRYCNYMIAAVMAVGMQACTPQIQIDESDHGQSLVRVSMNVSGTRATAGVDSETSVSDIQLMVFDAHGILEDYLHLTSSTSGNLGVIAGESKTFVALVNAPAVNNVGRLSELDSRITRLEDNSAGHFVMQGRVTRYVSAACSVDVSVKRIVSRISIRKVTAAFESQAMADRSFELRRVYLINAAGSAQMDMTPRSDSWYNENGYHASVADGLLMKPVGAQLTGNGSADIDLSFYCYPNDFSAHDTVLELECIMDGTTEYYCIDFSTRGVSSIECNKTYTVDELLIRHRGNDDGTGRGQGSATIDCSVSVADWETGLAPYTETL